MNKTMTSGPQPHAFPPTRWSLVLAARRKPSPESAVALETVCRAYWYPLYAYVRRCGQSPHDAQDTIIHGVILVSFSIGCFFLWGLMQVPRMLIPGHEFLRRTQHAGRCLNSK
jgi:hypothetical protein